MRGFEDCGGDIQPGRYSQVQSATEPHGDWKLVLHTAFQANGRVCPLWTEYWDIWKLRKEEQVPTFKVL